jgi:hypothetical protein
VLFPEPFLLLFKLLLLFLFFLGQQCSSRQLGLFLAFFAFSFLLGFRLHFFSGTLFLSLGKFGGFFLFFLFLLELLELPLGEAFGGWVLLFFLFLLGIVRLFLFLTHFDC